MANRIFNYSMVCILAMLLASAGLTAQTITFTKQNVTCNGGSNGSITMTLSGGSSSYRYVYYKTFMPSVSDSFGPTNNLNYTFTDLDPDYYTVFVRDVITDNVIDFNTMQITQPAVLNATVTSANISCFGANNGTITISSATGGSGAWEYSINGGGTWQATGVFTLLPPATYNVRIRDKNDPTCIKILNGALVISQAAQLNATLTFNNVTCFAKSKRINCGQRPRGRIWSLPVQPERRFHVAGFRNLFTPGPRHIQYSHARPGCTGMHPHAKCGACHHTACTAYGNRYYYYKRTHL